MRIPSSRHQEKNSSSPDIASSIQRHLVVFMPANRPIPAEDSQTHYRQQFESIRGQPPQGRFRANADHRLNGRGSTMQTLTVSRINNDELESKTLVNPFERPRRKGTGEHRNGRLKWISGQEYVNPETSIKLVRYAAGCIVENRGLAIDVKKQKSTAGLEEEGEKCRIEILFLHIQP